ncbi:hypothetical protein [Dolichospermum planctonicum]|uniref:hypothetical protein n=1 Tax=Dolichospermum planctonicum TaxID=136072 RepID=UPI00232F29DE|nr:hypothetical protein [Dolichospermum planctonicum]
MDKEEEARKIKTDEDLGIYRKAFNAAMTIFELSKRHLFKWRIPIPTSFFSINCF